MSFTVDPNAVRGFARTLGDLVDDADAAGPYVREHLGIGYDKGRMFFTVVETATTVREALLANYTALAKLADQCEVELGKAADHYGKSDHDSAARLDASYDSSR
jgi:hypothetical protein